MRGGQRRCLPQVRFHHVSNHFLREDGVGFTRILAELEKSGVGGICRCTVRDILRENGFDTDPKRGVATWDNCIKIQDG
jgi:hypothetical protein